MPNTPASFFARGPTISRSLVKRSAPDGFTLLFSVALMLCAVLCQNA
jgi:hypothetical protein